MTAEQNPRPAMRVRQVADLCRAYVLPFLLAVLAVALWWGGGAVLVTQVGRWAVNQPAGEQYQLVLLAGTAMIMFCLLRAVLRRATRTRVVASAPDALGHAVLARAGDTSRALGDFPDRGFRAWVLARVDPDATDEEIRAAAQQWWPQWEKVGQTTDDRREVAVHEAAHAVVAHALGGTVVEATTIAAPERRGHISWVLPIPNPGQHESAWIALQISLAGQAADLREGVHDIGSATDVEVAIRHAAQIISTGRTPTDYDGPLRFDDLIAAARVRATELLAEHADVVEDVTAQLLERRALAGRDLHRLLAAIDRAEVAA